MDLCVVQDFSKFNLMKLRSSFMCLCVVQDFSKFNPMKLRSGFMCLCVVQDFSKFNPMKQKLLDHVDRMLAEDIAVLMNMIPKEDESQGDVGTNVVKGGAFEGYKESPFGVGRLEGVDKGRGDEEWVVAKDRYKYDEIFQVWFCYWLL